ncbi:YraN family protein [Paenibacillus flagellatus]|uniref:UPF0102 protein DLM86_29330 n=1 Tax=Paenibacillus flagellatus TaxID=2211139 RepID=A0A2V5K986_9BACL|nr:YraN family protein [Paenibacillus flagellatus]PYI50350.1 YraN family protein [Paenibacillus flagellatus]
MTDGKPNGDRRRALGSKGETIAADHLAAEGYRIVDRNWRCPAGEIDLVAEKDGVTVFVEVRSRRETGTFGTPEESVDARKQRRIREVAQMYLYRHKAFDRRTRFDVVAVTFAADGSFGRLNHIQQAF